MGAARSAVSTAALLAAAATVWGDQAADSQPAPYDEELSVEVINVEVHVTDRKGRPVRGLGREAFRLLEDGRPVEIDYFTEIDEAAPPPATSSESPSADARPAAAAVAAAREVRNLVIYLDDSNVGTAGRRRVLSALKEAIASGNDGADRLMLVVHDEGLHVVQPFTGDRQAVLAAIDGVAGRVTGIWKTLDRRDVFRAIQDIYKKWEASLCGDPCECGWREMEATVRDYAGLVATQVAATADGLSQMISALSGVEGRNLLVYVSDGVQQRPGLDLFHYVAQVCPEFELELTRNYIDRDQAPLIHRLTSHANANGVTFYTLEGAGLETNADVSEVSLKFSPSALIHQVATTNRQSPLFALADDTGGLAALNTNTFDGALQAMAADLGSYYSLGFTSRHRGDGRLHRLAVEVEGRGLRVRHRDYYLDKELETRLAERVWSTLLLDTGSNAMGVEVAIGEPLDHVGRECCSVPVEIELPIDRISLGEAGIGRFYVVLAGRASNGKVLPIKGREVVLEAQPGEGPQSSRTLVVEVDLAPGPHDLAIGLLDYQSGGEAYVRAQFDVKAPAGGAPPAR
jgi:VWFA-related protein